MELQRIINEYTDAEYLNSTPIIDGLVNQVSKVELADRTVIVRIDPEETDTRRFLKEEFCINEARKVGITTPQMLKVGLIEGHPYAIMEYIEGSSGVEHHDQVALWRTLGDNCRRIHSISVAGFGENYVSGNLFDDSWERYLEYNIGCLDEKDKAIALGVYNVEQQSAIQDRFNALRAQDVRMGLLHHDICPRNCIVDRAGIVHLIDWGSAKVGPVPHIDIAEVLDSTLKDSSQEFEAFLEGYSMARGEYETMKAEIRLVNFLEHIDKLRWALDRRPDKIKHYSGLVRAMLPTLL